MSSIFESILTGSFSLASYLLCLLCAGICGGIAALAVSHKNTVSRSFMIALIVLPIIVTTVILMVNGNVGTGIAVAGAFSRDISVIFLVMAAGLACAAGYLAIALLFTVIASSVIALLSGVTLRGDRKMALHITVPETLHFADAFDDLFARYAREWKLKKAKTSNMGSLYRLEYDLELKDRSCMQEFLDALRCRNGNLEIALLEHAEGDDVL